MLFNNNNNNITVTFDEVYTRLYAVLFECSINARNHNILVYSINISSMCINNFIRSH